MNPYPRPLNNLIKQLSKLPGIGQKSATRMALFILKSKRELVEDLVKSLIDVKEKITLCSTCFNLTDTDPCTICADPDRLDGTICVVESPGDQMAIEEAGIFKGRYHVLHGVLSPLDGIGPEDLKIEQLLHRINKEKITEVIIATNPSTAGETTASFLVKLISEKDPDIKISKIALGIPMGGDLKYMDRITVKHALQGRVPFVP
ncbi:MAG: recombination protein RecR [Desulfobacteraceae bacterium 4484_190.1]|nr:MAG: recombination protein RecR [Desulfobacteraceae bacterium 4484_190.1]